MPTARLYLGLVMLVFLAACAADRAARHVEVETDPLASQFTPRQVARILAQLGWQSIRWYDFESGQTGVTISTAREVKMKFRSPEYPEQEVYVYFRFYTDSKKLRLGLVEPNRKQPSPDAVVGYEEILAALRRNFGADKVTELKRSLIPPP
jgi:hypothetical protein